MLMREMQIRDSHSVQNLRIKSKFGTVKAATAEFADSTFLYSAFWLLESMR